jgi:hypothetical protein
VSEREDAERARAKRLKIMKAVKQAPDSKAQSTNSAAIGSPVISSTTPKPAAISKPDATKSSSLSKSKPQQKTSSASDSLGQGQSYNVSGHLINQDPVTQSYATDDLPDYESDGNENQQPPTRGQSSLSISTGLVATLNASARPKILQIASK